MIDGIAKSYPYFIPARYIKAMDAYRRNPGAPMYRPLVAGYTGNPILFQELLDNAVGAGPYREGDVDPFLPVREHDIAFDGKRASSVFDEAFDDTGFRTPNQRGESTAIARPAPVAPAGNIFQENVEEIEDAVFEESAAPADVAGNWFESDPVADASPTPKEGFGADPRKLQEEADAMIREFMAKQGMAQPEAEPIMDATEISLPPTEELNRAPFTVAEVIEAPTQSIAEAAQAETARVADHAQNELADLADKLPQEELHDPAGILHGYVSDTVDKVVPEYGHGLLQHENTADHATTEAADLAAKETESLVSPIFTEDYFLQQGVHIPNEVPADLDGLNTAGGESHEDKSLMVMMRFNEWLMHFKSKMDAESSEPDDNRHQKSIWQKEQLAAAIEEENDEIPEEVFDLAMTSIHREEGLVSESLAEIYLKQGKYDKAVEMFRKLGLRNPEKSTYFAAKAEEIIKEKLS